MYLAAFGIKYLAEIKMILKRTPCFLFVCAWSVALGGATRGAHSPALVVTPQEKG